MSTLVRSLSLPKSRNLIVALYGGAMMAVALICFAIAHQTIRLFPNIIEHQLRQNCTQATCVTSDLSLEATAITALIIMGLAMTFVGVLVALIEHLNNEHLRSSKQPMINLIDPFVSLYGWSIFTMALLVGLIAAGV